jgi:D-alanyl-D-alanine carboxypeptidase (penicillin-binding protein 5/6)
MDFTFENWSKQTVVKSGATFTAAHSFPVQDGVKDHVMLELKDDVTMWVQKGMDLRQLRVVYRNLEDGKITAPVKIGDKIGTVQINLEQDQNGYLENDPENNHPMIASENIARANFFVVLFNRVVQYVSSRLN